MLPKPLLFLGIALLFCDAVIFAQNNFLNTSTTSVPFLRTETDARSAGMGATSVAALNDANAIFHNASKNIFADDSIGIAINYRNRFEESLDAHLLSASAFYRLNEKNVLSAGYRNLNASIDNFATGVISDEKVHESVFDLNYSRKINSNFAAGITLKYIHTNLPYVYSIGSGVNYKPAYSLAGDISCIYKKDISFSGLNSEFTIGVNMSNMGGKITYTSSIIRDFIPANIGVGAGYAFEFSTRNKLLFTCDLNKLMVPTPDTTDSNPTNGISDYRELSSLKGMIHSFSDAPGGFEEELHEINLATGLEYNFDDQLFIRGGYFYEHPTKGGRQFYTTGAGLRYKFLQYDIAYLIPADIPQNALEPVVTMTLAASF